MGLGNGVPIAPGAARYLGRVASAGGASARRGGDRRSRVAVVAFLWRHLAHDEPALRDGASDLLPAGGLSCVLELSLCSPWGHSCFLWLAWIGGGWPGFYELAGLASRAGTMAAM